MQEPERGVGSFEIEITSATRIERPVTLLASEARELAMLLDGICEADGDAREYTTQLTEWHDRLLGLDSD